MTLLSCLKLIIVFTLFFYTFTGTSFAQADDFIPLPVIGTTPTNTTTTAPLNTTSSQPISGTTQKSDKMGIGDAMLDTIKTLAESAGVSVPALVATNDQELAIKATRAKVLSGRLLSRLTKILVKEEALVTAQASTGFSSKPLDDQIIKIKNGIELATQKISLLESTTPVTDIEVERTRLENAIAEVKASLQLIKDDQRELISMLDS